MDPRQVEATGLRVREGATDRLREMLCRSAGRRGRERASAINADLVVPADPLLGRLEPTVTAAVDRTRILQLQVVWYAAQASMFYYNDAWLSCSDGQSYKYVQSLN